MVTIYYKTGHIGKWNDIFINTLSYRLVINRGTFSCRPYTLTLFIYPIFVLPLCLPLPRPQDKTGSSRKSVGHFTLFPLFGKEGLGEILLIITHSISFPKKIPLTPLF
jgi:hypothetical protein